jgi:FixJ family two-component response regulator
MRSEKSAGSHVVCLVDDDPLVLNSLRYLLASDGIAAHSFDDDQFFAAVHDALAQANASQELLPEAIVDRPKVP